LFICLIAHLISSGFFSFHLSFFTFFIGLLVHLSIIHLSIRLYFHLSIYQLVHLTICPFFHLPIFPSVRMYIGPFVQSSYVHLFIFHLSIRPFVHVSIFHFSIYLICLFVCLSVLFIVPFVHLLTCPFVYFPFVYSSFCPFVHVSIIHISICPFDYLSLCSWINFINILCTRFSYESKIVQLFSSYILALLFFWRQNRGKKRARKMLMKLTPDFSILLMFCIWGRKQSCIDANAEKRRKNFERRNLQSLLILMSISDNQTIEWNSHKKLYLILYQIIIFFKHPIMLIL